MQTTQVKVTIPSTVDPLVLMGPYDQYLRHIEDAFESLIAVRGNQVTIIGATNEVDLVVSLFAKLIEFALENSSITASDVDRMIEYVKQGNKLQSFSSESILMTPQGTAIKPKTEGQKRYAEAIRNNTITFCMGPAGTGKTYLAMAMALSSLMQNKISRIVLTRPVVEAGESLGFLPGTLSEKLDPYVRPLYDALFEMCGADRANMLVTQNVIEIAPLAFMRGRTFNDAFVILDEAQNTTPAQMKMFLTRLGYNSTFVVTGDKSQRDTKGENGLASAEKILKDIDSIKFVGLSKGDIVRHKLVAQIVDAYDKHLACESE